MAIHDYKCNDCGEISEILIFSSDDKPSCGKCGSQNLEKLMSGFAVSIKASSGGEAPCGSPKRCGGCPGRR